VCLTPGRRAALFFLAFLPRFVTPNADLPTARLETLTLGTVFFALALALDLCCALAGAVASVA
jgi:threonine/homoserine/homoserine lactone efflux protein